MPQPKLLALCLLLLCTLCPALHAQTSWPEGIPKQPDNYITDRTDTLPAGQAQALNARLKAFEDSTSVQIAVLITPTMGSWDERELSIAIANAWGIGQAETDNGVLLVIYLNERRLVIEVGYGLEADIPDLYAHHIIHDDIIPYFKRNDLPGGVDAGVQALMEAATGTYVPEDIPGSPRPPGHMPAYFPWVLFSYLLTLLYIGIRRGMAGKWNGLRQTSTAFSWRAFWTYGVFAHFGVGIIALVPLLIFGFVVELFNRTTTLYYHFFAVIFLGAAALGSFIIFSQPSVRFAKITKMIRNVEQWAKLKEKYRPEDVDKYFDQYQTALRRLAPTQRCYEPLKTLEKRIQGLWNRPHGRLKYRLDYLEDRIQEILANDRLWNVVLKPYDASEVAAFKQLAEDIHHTLTYEDEAERPKAEDLHKQLNQLTTSDAEDLFAYDGTYLKTEISTMLGDDKFWRRLRVSYTATSVATQKKKLQAAYDKALKKHQQDPQALQEHLNTIWRTRAQKLKNKPAKLLTRKPTYSSSSSGSFGSSGSSFSSSSFSGGGGSFGGGGSSGGW